MKFEPYGPFQLPRADGDIDTSRKREFWETVKDVNTSLPDAVGCYIFAMKAAKGYKPWYVGMTRKMSFKGETWEAHKLLGYGKVIRAHKGSPMLFLLAKVTPKGRFAKPTKKKGSGGSISALEEMLIGVCLQRNKELLNKRTTKYINELHVPGFVNETPGKRSKNAKELALLLHTK